jgi:hypothetical protein
MTRFSTIVMALLAIGTSLLSTLPTRAEQPTDVTSKMAWTDGFAPQVWSISTAFRSQYVFSNGALAYDKFVAQPNLFVKLQNGFTMDVWSSIPVDTSDIGDNFGTELDFTVGWSGEVYGFNLNLNANYYDMYRVFRADESDMWVPTFETSYDFALTPEITVSPYFKLEVNFTTNGATVGETFERLGTRVSWKMNDLVTLAGDTYALYDPGILGGDVAWIGSAEASVLWDVGGGVIVEFPYVRVISPFDSTKGTDDRGTEIIYGAGMTLNF